MFSAIKKHFLILFADFLIFTVCVAGMQMVIKKAGLSPSEHISFEDTERAIVVDGIFSGDYAKHCSLGDSLVSFNGIIVDTKDDIEFIFDNMAIGDTVLMGKIINGKNEEFAIIAPAYYNLRYVIIQFIAGSLFLLIAVFVFLKRSENMGARVFHWACIGAAIIIMCTWGKINAEPDLVSIIPRALFNLAYAFEPVLFLQLSFVFPVNKWKYQSGLFNILYSLSLLLFLYTTITLFFAIYPVSIERFHIFMLGFDMNRLIFALAILAGLISFFHSYIKAKESEARKKLKWVLLGLVLGPLTYVSLWQIPQLFAADSLIPEEIIVLIITVTPLTFAISIVKYNAFDIDHIVNRSTVYFIVGAMLLIFYAGMVLLAAFILGQITIESSLIASALVTIMLPAIFEPARRRVQKFVDKKFFRVRYNYSLTESRITKGLDRFVSEADLAIFTVNELAELFKPECLGFYLQNKKTKRWTLLAEQNCPEIQARRIRQMAEAADDASGGIMCRADKVESGADIIALAMRDKNNQHVALVAPVRLANNKVTALIVVGEKKSGFQFTLEDIDLFNSIAEHVGLTIEKIQMQREIMIKHEEAKRLQELNDQISLFVASVGHELKTPLTSIGMYSELMQENTELAENDAKYLWTIKGESRRLERLINNVLDISKIERGEKTYKFAETDLVDIAEQALEIMGYLIKQHDFEVELSKKCEYAIVNADREAMIQVLINLVSNAIKYSAEDKKINLEVSTVKDTATISVEDHGIGILKKDQQNIFRPFFRSDRKDVHLSPGTGLGLSLVKHIVDAHNGEITIESAVGSGTKFIITLPMKVNNEKNSGN